MCYYCRIIINLTKPEDLRTRQIYISQSQQFLQQRAIQGKGEEGKQKNLSGSKKTGHGGKNDDDGGDDEFDDNDDRLYRDSEGKVIQILKKHVQTVQSITYQMAPTI